MTPPSSPTDATACPRCSSPRIVRGTVTGGDNHFWFSPTETRFFTFHGRVSFAEVGAQACIECGMFWLEIDRRELAKTLEKGGTDTAKAWMAEQQQRPL